MYLYIGLFAVFIVLVLTSIKKRKPDDCGYLSKDTTVAEKGLAAVIIVFHHISQAIELPKYFVIMNYVGFIMVAIFFFISGYGLSYGLENKEGYLNNFFKKRILSILIPYWIVNTISIVYNLATSKTFTPLEYIASYLGFDTITGTWFVTAILIMYLAFWFCYKLYYDKKTSWTFSTIILMAIIVVYCIVCYILSDNSSYTASISAFALGVVWNKLFNERFTSYLKKNYVLKLCAVTILFGIFFVGRLGLSYIGINWEILHIIVRNIVTVCFVLLLLTVTYKIDFKSKIITTLGIYSYEIYICHYLSKTVISNLADNSYLFILLVIALTVLLSLIVHKINQLSKKAIKG